MRDTYRSQFNRHRVETFSDGILAIIITLLVLEIKVPVTNQEKC